MKKNKTGRDQNDYIKFRESDSVDEDITDGSFTGSRFIQMNRNYRDKGPKGYKRSCERILEDACDRLLLDRDIDASGIEVTMMENCLILRGEVRDREDKKRAEALVENVYGVHDVFNLLKISSLTLSHLPSLESSDPFECGVTNE